MVICALKSPVREIATIQGTSIHQKNDKTYYNHWERERVVCTKRGRLVLLRTVVLSMCEC